MNTLKQKMQNFAVEQLEERKEFTFYGCGGCGGCCPPPPNNCPPPTPTPPPGPTPPPTPAP